MGILEKEAKRKHRKDYIQKAVLATVGIAGMLAVAAVAPNTLRLLGGYKTTRRFPYRAQTALGRLVAKGYVRFEMRGEKRCAVLTDSGKRSLEFDTQLSLLRARRTKKWDRRWRMIMFDIPERRKNDRDALRRTMIEAGFLCFQDSVWIYPYECEDFVRLLKIDRHFGNAVRYAIIESLENDAAIRMHFDL